MKVTWKGTEDEALETFAFGRRWEANVPQEVDPRAGYDIDEAKRVDKPDGTWTLVSTTRRVTYLEMMRQNPCFDVEDEAPKVHKKRGRPPKIHNAAEDHAIELSIGE